MMKIIATFLLFTFFTQTVLAGIDVHSELKNGNEIDILEHYIDEHTNDSECMLDSQTDHDEVTAHTDIDSHHDVNGDNHQHSCHGHTSSFLFEEFSLLDLDFTRFYSKFFYLLTIHSTELSMPIKPPIVS